MAEDYEAPEVKLTGTSAADKADAAATAQAKQSVKDVSAPEQTKSADNKDPSLEVQVPLVVGIGDMIGAKGNVVTDIMKARIAQHWQYLKGEIGYKDAQQSIEEQIGFIETIGNTLKLDYEQYVVVTDYILQQIREDITVFSESLAFRFITKELQRKYNGEHIKTYQAYLTLLSKIAMNWKVRYKLNTLLDPRYVMENLTQKGKENLTQYFRKLSSV